MSAESTDGGARAPSTLYRWVVLLAVSLPMFGNYYVYDSINPLNDIFARQLEFSDTQIGWLYSSYSVAAPFMLLVGVFLIDRMGLRVSMALFSFLCFLSAAVMVVEGSFPVMVAGRALLGLGAEMLIVAVTASLAKWFRGKELGFAFGINLAIARLASIAADRSPSWARALFYPDGPEGDPSWRGPLWLAVGAGALCLVGAAAYWCLEVRAEKRWVLGVRGAVDKLNIAAVLRLPWAFWCIVGLCVAFYSGIFPFRTFAVKFFMHTRFGMLPEQEAREAASFFNSVLPTAALVATPLFGLLADKLGRRALFMAVGSVLLMPVYLLMMYATVSLWVPIALMGTAFSLVPAVMWPAVPSMVEETRVGSAYALMGLFQQFGLSAMPLLVGRANDHFGAGPANPMGYAPGMWVFSAVGVVGFAFALLLRREERRREAA
ncbi:MAG TPA: MFS transporter [Planctomycetes bacterium]|nr:MFS transporter [Planctomycetota bacterium]